MAPVEHAMGIVQLTGVLIPLLLGVARYYVSKENSSQVEASDKAVLLYTAPLFLSLLFAYGHALTMIFEYGNYHLTSAVIAYGSFLTILYAAVPYPLGQKQEAYIFGGVGFIILLISFIRFSRFLLS